MWIRYSALLRVDFTFMNAVAMLNKVRRVASSICLQVCNSVSFNLKEWESEVHVDSSLKCG